MLTQCGLVVTDVSGLFIGSVFPKRSLTTNPSGVTSQKNKEDFLYNAAESWTHGHAVSKHNYRTVLFFREGIACFSLQLIYWCAYSLILPELIVFGWAASSSGTIFSRKEMRLFLDIVSISCSSSILPGSPIGHCVLSGHFPVGVNGKTWQLRYPLAVSEAADECCYLAWGFIVQANCRIAHCNRSPPFLSEPLYTGHYAAISVLLDIT